MSSTFTLVFVVKFIFRRRVSSHIVAPWSLQKVSQNRWMRISQERTQSASVDSSSTQRLWECHPRANPYRVLPIDRLRFLGRYVRLTSYQRRRWDMHVRDEPSISSPFSPAEEGHRPSLPRTPAQQLIRLSQLASPIWLAFSSVVRLPTPDESHHSDFSTPTTSPSPVTAPNCLASML